MEWQGYKDPWLHTLCGEKDKNISSYCNDHLPTSWVIQGPSYSPYDPTLPSAICFHGDVELASLTGFDFSPMKGNAELGRMLVKASGKDDSHMASSLFMGACVGGHIEMVKEFYQAKMRGAGIMQRAVVNWKW